MLNEADPPFRFLPVTRERLADLQRFSRQHGKFRYCSCMRWRMRSATFNAEGKEGRESRLEAMICEGIPVGVLGYFQDQPIGWCSIAPRQTLHALERYRALPRLDDEDVWSVTCFFIDRQFRGRGLRVKLLRAAVLYAGSCGAKIVEGYPVDPNASSYTYMGAPGTFEQAGFTDVTPRGQKRRVFRIAIN